MGKAHESADIGTPSLVKIIHAQNPKLFAQEGLLVDACEEIWHVMNKQGVTKAELAKRIGCSRAHVTMVLNGTRNMTLRTLADLAGALGYQPKIRLVPK